MATKVGYKDSGQRSSNPLFLQGNLKKQQRLAKITLQEFWKIVRRLQQSRELLSVVAVVVVKDFIYLFEGERE